ncbi:hypothetical protein J2D69_14780 [Lysinibacillus sphaericus]|nr:MULTISPECIES: hypothetical protein [Lysinibacillus]MBE5084188.1 hypothetical protein [Bacillus thuringiensis]EWH33472.1 hypothetical protein P799_12870 [Lysinibacillus sphaericus CBAM5]MCS1397282.1 hypothetical protein [Lysinibacillus sp. PB211]MDR0159633.1 hypothetical protein [Lysinibacillus sphaericus]QPA48524.1 hypothetical protein INQ54_14085 [Lysinibacillus sphaericus]
MNLGRKNLSSKDSKDILIELTVNSKIQEKERKKMVDNLSLALNNENFTTKKKRKSK